jgi:toxin ParE1/3/4
MSVEYSKRSVADLHKLSADIRRAFGDRAAEAIEERIREIVKRIAEQPESAPRLADRPGIRVVPLIPLSHLYRMIEGQVRILHIRHTSRKPRQGGE